MLLLKLKSPSPKTWVFNAKDTILQPYKHKGIERKT